MPHKNDTHDSSIVSESNKCFNPIVLSQGTIDPGGE